MWYNTILRNVKRLGNKIIWPAYKQPHWPFHVCYKNHNPQRIYSTFIKCSSQLKVDWAAANSKSCLSRTGQMTYRPFVKNKYFRNQHLIIFFNKRIFDLIKLYLLRLFLEKTYVVFVTFSPDSTQPAAKTEVETLLIKSKRY